MLKAKNQKISLQIAICLVELGLINEWMGQNIFCEKQKVT